MKDRRKTNQQLIEENSLLKQRIEELERLEENHRLVEKGLRFSEQQLQLLIDSAPDFFF